MLARLIRQDNAVNQMYISQTVAFFIGVTIRMISKVPLDIIRMPSYEQSGGYVAIYALIWGLFLFMLVATNITQRCSRMSMILPLSSRRLWLTRILSIIIVEMIPVAILTLVISLRFPEAGRPALDPGVWLLGAHTGAGLILVAVLLQAPGLELYRIRADAKYVLYAILVSVAVLVVTILGMRSPLFPIFFLGAALLLGSGIYFSLPGTFSLAAVRPGDGGAWVPGGGVDVTGRSSARGPAPIGVPTGVRVSGAEPAYAETAGSDFGAKAGAREAGAEPAGLAQDGFRKLLHLTCFRVLVSRWYVWMFFLALGFYSVMTVIAYHDGGNKDNPYGFFMFVWIIFSLVVAIREMHKLDFLPVSRKLLFAHAMLPPVLAMLLGFGLGNLIAATRRYPYRQIHFYSHTIQIPDEFWEITREGEPPLLTSPWGETHVPESYPLYRGSGIIIYKPFDCGRESSAEFVAFQLERAVEAIHGVPFDPSNRYGNLDDSSVQAAGGCCFAVEASAGRWSEGRNRAYAVGSMLLAVFYMLIFLLQLRSFRATFLKNIYAFTAPGALILLVLVIGLVVAGDRAGFNDALAVAAVPSILMRKIAEWAPVSTPALWLIFVAICAGGYLALQSAFQKIEVLPHRQKPFLEAY